MTSNNNELWVFGYGSLIWRADFSYAEKKPACIYGWQRRFWQGSTDHRGRPGSPGRVVTLVPSPDGECQGIAYRLQGEDQQHTLESLDYREKGGYQRLEIPIQLNNTKTVRGITYFATPDNPNFLGDAELAAIAKQIILSEGPSGHNLEYLFELEKTLLQLKFRDQHISALAAEVRRLQAG